MSHSSVSVFNCHRANVLWTGVYQGLEGWKYWYNVITLHTTWEIAWSKFDVIKILNILVVSFSYDEASYKMYENLFILVLLVIYYILPKTKMGEEMNSTTPSVVV